MPARRFLLILLWWPITPAWCADLRALLEVWSQRSGVAVQGLENVASEAVADTGLTGMADAQARLPSLLQGYNYLIVSGQAGRIEKLVIIGPKGRAAARRDTSVELQRDGLHHRVDALLTGANGRQITTTLILDTGASNVVLPASLIEPLGLRAEHLVPGTSQTASGSVAVRNAQLAVLRVGEHEARDVAVSFVDDRRLGDLRLLGMSFLRRFLFTIDDEHQRLILVDR